MSGKWIAALMIAGAAATAMFWPMAAQADDADTLSDLKCIAAGLELATNSDPQLQGQGQLMALYFLGRVDGRAPDQDIPVGVLTQAKAMDEEDLAQAVEICGKTLSERAQVLVDTSDALAKMTAADAPKD